MNKEISVYIPEGYEIDKENSTFECIRLKPIIRKKWRDSNPEVRGFYLGGNTIHTYPLGDWQDGNLNVFATDKQAKSALAMAQISQIMANDERFGGVVTYEEWEDRTYKKYIIVRMDNEIFAADRTHAYDFLAFHTAEQRDLFLEENQDLVKDYLMLD